MLSVRSSRRITRIRQQHAFVLCEFNQQLKKRGLIEVRASLSKPRPKCVATVYPFWFSLFLYLRILITLFPNVTYFLYRLFPPGKFLVIELLTLDRFWIISMVLLKWTGWFAKILLEMFIFGKKRKIVWFWIASSKMLF